MRQTREQTKNKRMKLFNEISKNYTPEEIAESYVFPGSKNKEIRRTQIEAFQQYRRQQNAEKDKLINLLLRLKFQIEDYISKIK